MFLLKSTTPLNFLSLVPDNCLARDSPILFEKCVAPPVPSANKAKLPSPPVANPKAPANALPTHGATTFPPKILPMVEPRPPKILPFFTLSASSCNFSCCL